MTGPASVWAAVAAADQFSVDARDAFARSASEGATRSDRVVFVTCHRVEAYGVGARPRSQPQNPEPGSTVVPHLVGDEAVRHLVRLAAGLESAVVGEDQVLHQVRGALAGLRERDGDPRLLRLFELAVAAGRRARAAHPAADRNLGELAVRWLERRAGQLDGATAVVAGAGPIGRAAAAALARRGARIAIASRSSAHAATAAARVHGAQPTGLQEAARLANQADAVIVALRGPWPEFMPRRGTAVVDLSVPTAVSPAAREALGEDFADVDRMYREAASLASDGAAISGYRATAEALVETTVAAYRSWLLGRGSVATLRTLRARSEAQRSAEVERLLRRMPDLGPRERDLVEAFSQRLVAGLLHAPSVALREDADGSAAEATARLFGL